MAWPLDFMVTGWRRSGTTMFVSLLNDHPDIDCNNDSFNFFFFGPANFDFLRDGTTSRISKPNALKRGMKTLDPFLVPKWKYPSIMRRAKIRGIESEIPPFEEYQSLIEGFTQSVLDTQPPVINVVRATLAIYVSETIALQRREFKYRTDFEERFRLVFDIDHFRRWFAVKQEIDARIAFLKPPERTLHVYYEDFRDAEKRQAVMEGVFNHIGVKPRNVEPATRKQLPESLRDSVVNYDEMIDMVRAEGWHRLADAVA